MTDAHKWCNCEALEQEITQMQAEIEKRDAAIAYYSRMSVEDALDHMEWKAAQAGEDNNG